MSIDTNLSDSWEKFVNNWNKTKKAFETISNPVAPVIGLEETANNSATQAVGNAAASAASTAGNAVAKTLGLPSFNSIVTIIIGVILIVLGIVFIGESNKMIQTAIKVVK
jgi:hypothetical protein